MRYRYIGTIVAAALVAWSHASAELDLRNATLQRLDNGLTVVLLEDKNFPIVNTQMLYRVGARDESYGQTGIAHFLEHMAFRGSENFPGTGLVSAIYAVGGEWHGYTWTDQTTYFSTVPKEHLDLLLRIEADRLDRLELSRGDMQAERGAVLAEMHMYENYPRSVLLDAVLFTSFLAHPYRNNTIGWQSDIENLAYEDVQDFYERHYQPANAVLAVVGDFDRGDVAARIESLFAGIDGGEATPLPHTLEPTQEGERRVKLYADTAEKRFMIAYRAPSSTHDDYAAFLVLQEVLGAGSGVNFRQNDWGVSVNEGSLLHGAADELTTWYPPSAQDYVFVIGGTIPASEREAALEQRIEERIASLHVETPEAAVVAEAIARVRDELVYDVETTEDAAHQLAFFSGLQALDVLLELPQRVSAVSATDVRRVAQRYLRPERRTIGWHLPDTRESIVPVEASAAPAEVPAKPPAPVDRTPVPAPVVRQLGGGLPVIFQPSDLSSAVWLQIVFRGNAEDLPGIRLNEPLWNHSSLAWRFRPDELDETLLRARSVLDDARLRPAPVEPGGSNDPETRLDEVLSALMSGGTQPVSPSPVLTVVSGNVGEGKVFAMLDRRLGDLSFPAGPGSEAAAESARSDAFEAEDIDVRLGRPIAQARLAYIVPAPAPTDEGSLAFRLLLYILSHDYEGRLGKEAISRRGLAYYIDSRYRSDGDRGWITLTVGVDPQKVADLRQLLQAELRRLHDEPPTAEEVDEARAHFIGRARSAAQSNRELSAALARDWLWYGVTRTPGDLEARLAKVTRDDVLAAVRRFTSGATVVVRE